MLFTTATCPNCRMAALFLDKVGIKYEKLLADENPELVEKYDIRQAPTMVVISGGKAEKIVNLSNIRAYTEKDA